MGKIVKKYSEEQSRAFVERLRVEPTGSGPLDGLEFAVKDLIDIAGTKTGCGNPHWRDSHPPAAVHAVCVEQMLAVGGRCIGKTVTDELAFGLLGENHFYGTPLNPRAPERVPGGSSSGSASAVACGLADFALGTDTGGSVRVPASYCGLYGFRPSHGQVSLAGVSPFAPSFDTVGVFARDADVFVRAAAVLVGEDVPTQTEPAAIHVLQEAFDHVDSEVRKALEPALELLRSNWGTRIRKASIRAIDGEAVGTGLQNWYETMVPAQWAEIWSCLGPWISANKTAFGPDAAVSFDLVKNLDRGRVGPAVIRRQLYARRLATFLGPHDLLCIPTTPTLAPLKGSLVGGRQKHPEYFTRTISLTCLAGIGRLPQVTLPLADVNGIPVGLSLLGAHRQDAFLLGLVREMGAPT